MSLPKSGWVPIPCLTADLIRQHPEVRPHASRTDMTGEFGEPCIYTEWGIEVNGEDIPVMREWRYPSRVPGEPDRRPCEHLACDNRKEADDDR
jgi:hypothetical protein